MEIPRGVGKFSVTIDYTYDPPYRLTAADYSSGVDAYKGHKLYGGLYDRYYRETERWDYTRSVMRGIRCIQRKRYPT